MAKDKLNKKNKKGAEGDGLTPPKTNLNCAKAAQNSPTRATQEQQR